MENGFRRNNSWPFRVLSVFSQVEDPKISSEFLQKIAVVHISEYAPSLQESLQLSATIVLHYACSHHQLLRPSQSSESERKRSTKGIEQVGRPTQTSPLIPADPNHY